MGLKEVRSPRGRDAVGFALGGAAGWRACSAGPGPGAPGRLWNSEGHPPWLCLGLRWYYQAALEVREGSSEMQIQVKPRRKHVACGGSGPAEFSLSPLRARAC